MKKLVYEQVLIKDGEVKARSPSIAGFYGAFTGQKNGAFSISYNVRERKTGPNHEQIMSNLNNNLDAERINQASAILYALLNIDTFEETVAYLADIKMTSPSHFIIGGTEGSQGVVLSRTEDVTEHRFEISEDDSNWFVAMTNVDVWVTTDRRYENAV